MKLRTRLAVAFLTVTVVPMLLIYMAFMGLSDYQTKSIRKTYGLAESVDIFSGNSLQIFNRLTKPMQQEIRQQMDKKPQAFEDKAYLDTLNERLSTKYAYMIVRKNDDIIYMGSTHESQGNICGQLLEYGSGGGDIEGGMYLDGDSQHLIKQMDFLYPDKGEGSLFIVSNVDELIPEVQSMVREMILSGVMILIFTGCALTMWVYRSILRPLGKLQEATKNIRDGNLEFTLEVEEEDEIGQLCQDFEEMRQRLKESTEKKIQYDKENKELISNISHDLKTPITAIKGYVEGIMDGVASSPEKLDKYIRTIYNKANDMDRLIDELTFYSKIDTNKIPYVYSKINVASYFKDCIEEVGLDLSLIHIFLSAEGTKTNVTLIFSAAQALLAARAGATYVSPFLGRLDDISMPGIDLINDITEIFMMHNIETEIIAASVRNPIHVIDCAKAGADIATVPYSVLAQMTKHPLTDQGIAKFQADYKAVFGE